MLDYLWIVIVIAIAPIIFGLSLGAVAEVLYIRYSKVVFATGQSGAEIARYMLDARGLHHVEIEMTPRDLSDHYDARAGVLRLSESVFKERTVFAAGIAAHEVGHAIQFTHGFPAS